MYKIRKKEKISWGKNKKETKINKKGVNMEWNKMLEKGWKQNIKIKYWEDVEVRQFGIAYAKWHFFA